MRAKIDPSRKRRTRSPPPRILPDDLNDYLDDRLQPRCTPRHDDDHHGAHDLAVLDDWPDRVPVTEAEIDIFERYFEDVLDRLFAPANAPSDQGNRLKDFRRSALRWL